MVSVNLEEGRRQKTDEANRRKGRGTANDIVRPALGARRSSLQALQPNGDPPDVMLWGDEQV